MNERPSQEEYAAFYEGYIHLVPEGNVIELLQKQAERVESAIRALSEEQANYRYDEGKWSVKEVFGHLIDNERIMSGRLLRIARGDKTSLPGYDQDTLMEGHPFEAYSVVDLAEEYAAVRYSTIVLLRRLSPEAWMRMGQVNDNTASTRSIAYVITGHELHHLSVLRDRYDVQI
ncbi:DinB family protein [Paenibacillus cucumis (ex Kampfer et al. 2016)]|uniref:DinB family protein n=1 Tax=Paenibacillus cucumis (ex Kampfer et al. 2016) TaxID=1776858 RepID=A0ABS7KGI3_9BACL|nr:DinB family protein [Paenibacillus cucumis (ex Kampfer et al. 2016)]MBY0203250.1 DinB family protein [Paenibacillus cucumis (ex Kampfer et al. 2016)]